MVKNINRVVGFTALLIILLVGISEYGFHDSWPFILLSVVITVSIFIELYFRIETKSALKNLQIAFLISSSILAIGIATFEPLLNHDYLITMGPNKTYKSDSYKIVGAKPLFGFDKSIYLFKLYELKFNGILVKKLEEVQGEWNDTNNVVFFPNSRLEYNLTTNKITKP